MKMKNQMVFFLAVMSVLFTLNFVSAAPMANIFSVEVDGVYALDNDLSVEAGESITVRVFFEALRDASDVRVEAELEGEKIDVDDKTVRFDVEEGRVYNKRLVLEIPNELDDEVSDDFNLVVRIWNQDHKSEEDVVLRVQRPSFRVEVMAISTDQRVEVGDNLPVDVAVKNIGYNKLDDLFVKVSIPELGIERESFFGDVVARECFDEEGFCDEDDEDVIQGRFYLRIPYDAQSGIYELRVEVENDDLTDSESVQVIIENEFSEGNVITTELSKGFNVGEEAEYFLVVANPTNKLKVFRVVAESSGDLTASVDKSLVAVPSGSSRTVKVTAKASSQGDYDFDVSVFSGEKLVSATTLRANVTGTSIGSPIAVLTIILAIVFLVLLIVLIVLLGKKPEKTEEFGESYY